MQAVSGGSRVLRGELAAHAVGEGWAAALRGVVALARGWWRLWLQAPRRLSGDDPSYFVRQR